MEAVCSPGTLAGYMVQNSRRTPHFLITVKTLNPATLYNLSQLEK
jgi:hypothetical protein